MSPTNAADAESDTPPSQHWVIAWHFCNTLVDCIPEFAHFWQLLGKPRNGYADPNKEDNTIYHVEPWISTHPLMMVRPKSIIIENVFSQACIGDPTDSPGVEDIRKHVVLVHGDLGTGEHILVVKDSCVIESKPCHRFQMVVFVLGLFHLLMACADAIWKMYIEPQELHDR
ncbi:hypothetical protein QCA50_012545 [Cerrena zonata]|uniref:DUF6589 domain-containing protein n=1 Tax=Cerrena zonata TaxID=2478898 RepID=A0AAW0FTR1_9APHY